MSRPESIQFVCYEEGGIIDLQRALDDLLPQTLVKLPPDEEPYPTTLDGPFKPTVRPLKMHLSPEDLAPPTQFRLPIFQHSVRVEIEVDPHLATPIFQRVYPFKREVREENDPQDQLPGRVERAEPPGSSIEPVRDSVDRLPQLAVRPQPPQPTFQSQRSFHDMLLIRAREREKIRRHESLTRSGGRRSFWIKSLTEICLFGGTGAIAAGFIAVNGGVSLQRAIGIVVASGLAIACTVLVFKIPKPGTKSLSNTARA